MHINQTAMNIINVEKLLTSDITKQETYYQTNQ